MTFRNSGMPFPIKRGFQHGSVDHQRSLNKGYRKHSNVLRIEASVRARRAGDLGDYAYLVYAFYID